VKLLSDILYKVRLEEVVGSTHIAIEDITADSRAVRPMGLFVAVAGVRSDGHRFISAATDAGAIAIICEEYPETIDPRATYVKVKSSADALGIAAANFYDNPSEKLKVVGVTGTNGKTTTATLLFQLARGMGYPSGLLSTVVNRINDKTIEATHTTPDAVSLQRLLADMVKAGCEYCFMEVSSHAIHQRRIAGLSFTGAVFTNITHDHLDYHGSFEEYALAKKRLFDDLPSGAFALSNADNDHGDFMLNDTRAKKRSYGLFSVADYDTQILENDFDGLQLNLNGIPFHSRLVGAFNAYNLLAVFATAIELGMKEGEVLQTLSGLEPVDGRFRHFKTGNGITAIVDYAHTPDALDNVLNTIGQIRTRNEKVITVVGCGGDRDRSKRPLMAAIAAQKSDQVILTSDNPRSEEPQAIIDEMKTGLDPVGQRKTISLTDRKEAIRLACTLAKSGDIILIAGKGHEKYQEIKGVKNAFDDFAIVTATLRELAK
jgi:UDP-N-acetylmuramoyl-L-alanyl-D-glutamate--2,6-diaminopimelate ligase